MFLPIRYSPSGPIIENANGGQCTPGPGFLLRQVDAQATAGALTLSSSFQQIPASGPTDFELELTNVTPGLRYGAEIRTVFASASNAVARVSLELQWSVDGGAFVSAGNPQSWDIDCVTIQSISTPYQSLLVLGSALSAPIPADGAASLKVRFAALVSTGTAVLTGNSLYGRLFETL
jgi:hypothetical protein